MRLSDYMAKRGLSDAAMAQRVGCSVATIFRLRLGHGRPSLERAYRIEQVTQGAVGLADWQYPVRYPGKEKLGA